MRCVQVTPIFVGLFLRRRNIGLDGLEWFDAEYLTVTLWQ